MKDFEAKKCFFIKIMVAILCIGCLSTVLIYYNNLNKNENKGNNGEFYESNFTDDCVLISIDHETSLTDKIFTAADFPGVDVKEVVYLSSKEGLVNMEEYNHILKIELNTHGKDKVLEAIEILEEFDFVEVAEPNYIGYAH